MVPDESGDPYTRAMRFADIVSAGAPFGPHRAGDAERETILALSCKAFPAAPTISRAISRYDDVLGRRSAPAVRASVSIVDFACMRFRPLAFRKRSIRIARRSGRNGAVELVLGFVSVHSPLATHRRVMRAGSSTLSSGEDADATIARSRGAASTGVPGAVRAYATSKRALAPRGTRIG